MRLEKNLDFNMAKQWSEIQDSNTYKELKPQEQIALQRRYFDNVIFKSDTFTNLSPTEQSILKTKFFSQGAIGQQQQQNANDIQLINQLQGSFPLDPKQQFGGIKSPALQHPRNIQRQKAYDELIKQGKTPEQIQFILDVNKRVEVPPVLGRTIGATIGSLALPAAINLIPGMAALPEEAITIPMALAKLGKIAAPLIGAGLGGGIGETTQIALEEKRLISKSEFLKAFGKEVAFEAGGRAFVRGGKFAFSPFVKRTIPEAANIIEDFRKVGGVLPPSQIDKRFTLSIADEVVRGSFGSKEIFQELAEKTATATDVYTDVLLDRMANGLPRIGTTQLGEEFAKGITRPEGFIFRLLDDLFTPLYKQIDDLTKTATASTGKLKTFAKPILEQDKRLKGLILDAGKDKLDRIMALPDKIRLKDLRDLRTSFLGDTRKLARDADKNAGILKQIAKITNDILYDPSTTKGLTPEARRLLENTNRLYAVSREGLEKTFSERLAKRLVQNPTSVIKELFPQKNPEAVKALRQSLMEPISGRPSKEGEVLWKQLRTSWFADLAETTTAGDVVNPRIFERGLRKMGIETIDEMLPDAEGKRQLKNMRDLFKAMSKKPAGGASLFIRGGQVGGAFMIYNGAQEGDWLQVTAGGALVFGPRLFAKLAAHPLGNRLVTSGIKLKPGSTSLVPITARMINLARQIDREEITKIEREKQRGRALTRQAAFRRRF